MACPISQGGHNDHTTNSDFIQYRSEPAVVR